MLVARARVVRKDGAQCLPPPGGQAGEQCLCADDLQHAFPALQCKPAGCFGMRVCVSQIGLDVKNRRAVHQVGTNDMQHRPVGCVQLYPVELYGGQPDCIRPEGRARSKHANAAVAS